MKIDKSQTNIRAAGNYSNYMDTMSRQMKFKTPLVNLVYSMRKFWLLTKGSKNGGYDSK